MLSVSGASSPYDKLIPLKKNKISGLPYHFYRSRWQKDPVEAATDPNRKGFHVTIRDKNKFWGMYRTPIKIRSASSKVPVPETSDSPDSIDSRKDREIFKIGTPFKKFDVPRSRIKQPKAGRSSKRLQSELKWD